jgi:two-component system KDP operon response regulator KdpE
MTMSLVSTLNGLGSPSHVEDAQPPELVPAVVAVIEAPSAAGPSLARLVRAGGYEALRVKDPSRVRIVVRRRSVDAVVAHVDALEPIRLLAAIRAPRDLPVVAVAEPGLVHPGDALDAGADDVVGIPLDPEEFLARLRAALRRARPAGGSSFVVSTPDFTIDLSKRSCLGPAGDVHLTGIEWRLVDVLCRRPGRLVGADVLLEHVWGPGEAARAAALRVHMYDLRRKLEPNPHQPRYFRTEPRLGVRFVPGGAGTVHTGTVHNGEESRGRPAAG